MGEKKYIVEIESAREAENGRPSRGAVYRNVLAKDGFKPLPYGLHSCWDIFLWVFYFFNYFLGYIFFASWNLNEVFFFKFIFNLVYILRDNW